MERYKYVRIFYVSILHLRSHCFEENNLDKTCNNWSSEFVESRAMWLIVLFSLSFSVWVKHTHTHMYIWYTHTPANKQTFQLFVHSPPTWSLNRVVQIFGWCGKTILPFVKDKKINSFLQDKFRVLLDNVYFEESLLDKYQF